MATAMTNNYTGDGRRREAFFRTDYKTREDGGEKIIEGYFIVYDTETELCDGFYEVMSAGSCAGSLRKNDIRALYNHNNDIVLGRSSAGTLILSEDSRGVKGTVIINQNDTEALNVYERVKRGDITGCSFGYLPVDEGYSRKGNGGIVTRVAEADVIEISVCPFPAYPQTAIEARQRDYAAYKKRGLEVMKAQAKERLRHVAGSTKA